MKENLTAALADAAENRQAIIERLMKFSETDMLLFWGEDKDLLLRQEKLWRPVLDWAQNRLKLSLKTTQSLDVPEQDKQTAEQMRAFLSGLNNKQLLCFLKAALDMRSVLLAAALVEGQLSAEQAFEAAFLEELWQSENWGVVEEAEQRHNELKSELLEIETVLKSAA